MSAIAGMAVEWDRPDPIDISFLYMSQEIRSRIQIVRQNQIVTGEYINATTRDQENCKVTILLYDEMGYADTLGVKPQSIISIHSFKCGVEVPLEYKKKLLFCVLEYIRDKVRTKMHTTTVAFSKELELEGIGAEEFYFDRKMVMEGEINKIMKACWPEKYTEPIHTPAPTAVFSSVSTSYCPSPSPSQSQSSYSGSSIPGSGSTSVEPRRSGGKKNHTNKKYTMKTRKNKKSKKRWSLKYKKSINCKRPRGFSQRQYCKYGRKKNLK
jgi:hypothetical protein